MDNQSPALPLPTPPIQKAPHLPPLVSCKDDSFVPRPLEPLRQGVNSGEEDERKTLKSARLQSPEARRKKTEDSHPTWNKPGKTPLCKAHSEKDSARPLSACDDADDSNFFEEAGEGPCASSPREEQSNVSFDDDKYLPVRRGRGKQRQIRKNKKPKRWTQEEHKKFMAGLRLHGKDWAKVAQFVGSRQISHIVSHGQKFLLRLERFLNHDEPIKDLTTEDAKFFYGILNKKINRTTIEKEIRLARNAQLKEKGFLFRIDKVKRKPKAGEPVLIDAVGLPGSDEFEDDVSLKEELENEEGDQISGSSIETTSPLCQLRPTESTSFHKSLGQSIKQMSSTNDSRQRITQMSLLRFGNEENDVDSSGSQGPKHQKRFQINDYFDFLKSSNNTIQLIVQKCTQAFWAMGDLKSPDQEVDIMIKIGDFLDAPLLDNAPVGALISGFANSYEQKARLFMCFPNLIQYMWKRLAKMMDEDCLSKADEPTTLFQRVVDQLTPEQLEEVSKKEIKMYYKKRDPKQEQITEDEFGLFKKNIELCTNFKHSPE